MDELVDPASVGLEPNFKKRNFCASEQSKIVGDLAVFQGGQRNCVVAGGLLSANKSFRY
jgi:hypothetical protein